MLNAFYSAYIFYWFDIPRIVDEILELLGLIDLCTLIGPGLNPIGTVVLVAGVTAKVLYIAFRLFLILFILCA